MVYASAQSSEAVKNTSQRLIDEQETPMIIERGMEEGAIERLKALSEKMNG